jgi:tetratricopeptide (TPR) repeat protein
VATSDDPRRSRGRPPLVPPTPREPIGRDTVQRPASGTRPPRQRVPSGASERQERPDLPEDTVVELPVRMRKEIDRTISPPARARDLKIALHLGSQAVDEEDLDTALRYLRWAKHLAPRYAAVREALGIALYLAGELSLALAELQTYRRLSGSNDQNHLIADCMRAAGRDVERAIDVALELVDDESVDTDRRIEAAIIAAAVQEELGQGASARRLVDRSLSGLGGKHRPSDEARARLLWFAADLAEREGSPDLVRAHLAELVTIDPAYPDASERLRTISRTE